MVVEKTVELARSIGLKTLVILSLSSMLGSGLFLLPAFAQEVAGPGMWFAFLLAGSVVIASAFSKAELASAMPQSGGFYVYAERTYGHLVGTISGLGLFASFMLKSAFALVGFAAYMAVITEHFGIKNVDAKAVAMVLLVFILIVNLTGVKAIKKVQVPIVTGAVAMVVVLCIMALFSGDFDAGRPVEDFQPVSLSMGTAAALVFVAFSGAIKVGAIGGEVLDPETNLPRGMIQSLFIATLLYAVVAYIMVGVMDPRLVHGGRPRRREPDHGLRRLGGEHGRRAHRILGGHHRHGVHGAGGRVVLVSVHLRHGQRRCAARSFGRPERTLQNPALADFAHRVADGRVDLFL